MGSALRLALVIAALQIAPATDAAHVTAAPSFPAAAPDPHATIVRRLSQFRADHRPRVVLALGVRRSSDGGSWYRLSLPGRPNGQRGWVHAEDVDVRPVANRITIFRGARRLEVRRSTDRRLLLSTRVAIGKPGAETPVGRDFYVQSRFAPTDPFYGVFALETTAYAPISDWPGGGLVGIHGTDAPELIGQAVSHGCVRLSNAQAAKLRRLAPLGTPIDIVD